MDQPSRPLTAVITGAGGGLGSALAQLLSRRGYRVIATDIAGTERRLDVTDAAACRALAREVQPDVWINNAGVLGAGDAATQSDEDIAMLIAVNLLGTINGSRAAALAMRERGGHILNIGSLASWMPVPGEAVYSATKHGVRAFTHALASELRDTPVRVSLLCPDGIWTPMLFGRTSDRSSAMSFTAGRLLAPAAVAAAALALLEHPRLVRSIPASRGLAARILGMTPALAHVLYPWLEARGRHAQQHRYRSSGSKTP